MRKTRIASYRCECGEINNVAADPLDNYEPREGDIAMCMGCGKLSIFTRKNTVRDPSPQEKLRLSLNPVVISAQIYIRGR
jgi:hypothetical protein